MAERRRGLGKGLGALIPAGPPPGAGARPVDVFFPQYGGLGNVVGVPADGVPVSVGQSAGGEPAKVQPSGEGAAGARDDAAPEVVPGDGRGSPAGHPAGEDTASRRREEVRPVDVGAGGGDGPARGSDGAGSDGAGDGAGDGVGSDGDLLPVPGAHFAEIPIDAIGPNLRQPRQVFDEDDLAELVGSIREVGILQPVVVRPVRAPTGGARYELIMGERRWRAAQRAGLASIPSIVRVTSDGDMLRDALLENLHRAELNPLEEAAAYQQLLEDFDCTHEELATRLARSRPQISNTIRLLRLPPSVQRRLAAGALSAGHARAVLGLREPGAIEELADRVVAEGLSVRATEDLVARGLAARPARPQRTPTADDGRLHERASWLSDRLEARVQISLGQRKGRIAIEFATVEDLDRILEALDASRRDEESAREPVAAGL